MNRSYDVAVIGGGVIGGSIAFQLAKQGKRVILLEKGGLAREASSAAAGMLAAQVEMGTETGPLFELAIQSRAMFPELVQELREISGIDAGLTRRGMLRIAMTEDEVEELQAVMAAQQKVGHQAEWLSGEAVRKWEPGLSEDIPGALYIAHDGHVLAPELSQAFLKSAAIYGVEIREYTPVMNVLFDQGKVHGVQTIEGIVECDQVVLAAGAWSGEVAQQIGFSLPVYPVKGECFSVLTHKPLLQATVFSHGCYMVPKKGGRLVVGATMKENTLDRKVSMDGLLGLMEKAKKLLPSIVDAEWEKAWAGIRPQTKDGIPYLGEHPEWKGLFLATGHFRNGILLSPITGHVIADLVIKGQTDINIDSFHYNRLGGRKLHELNH